MKSAAYLLLLAALVMGAAASPARAPKAMPTARKPALASRAVMSAARGPRRNASRASKADARIGRGWTSTIASRIERCARPVTQVAKARIACVIAGFSRSTAPVRRWRSVLIGVRQESKVACPLDRDSELPGEGVREPIDRKVGYPSARLSPQWGEGGAIERNAGMCYACCGDRSLRSPLWLGSPGRSTLAGAFSLPRLLKLGSNCPGFEGQSATSCCYMRRQ